MNFHVLNRVALLQPHRRTTSVISILVPHRLISKMARTEQNQFIRLAHQYNSVDWVIQKNDWNGDWKRYSRDNKKAILSKLVSNIKNLLHTRLTDTASKDAPYIESRCCCASHTW